MLIVDGRRLVSCLNNFQLPISAFSFFPKWHEKLSRAFFDTLKKVWSFRPSIIVSTNWTRDYQIFLSFSKWRWHNHQVPTIHFFAFSIKSRLKTSFLFLRLPFFCSDEKNQFVETLVPKTKIRWKNDVLSCFLPHYLHFFKILET